GYIVSACVVKEGILVLTDNSAHLVRYVQPPYIYGVFQLGTGCGPVSVNCLGQAGPVAAWVGAPSFWVWAGSLKPLPCDVQDYVLGGLNSDVAGWTFIAPFPSFSEVWWFYPDESSLDINRYVVWDYGDNIWSIGTLKRSAADQAGAQDYI